MLIQQYQRLIKSFITTAILLLMTFQVTLAAVNKNNPTRDGQPAKDITPEKALELLKAGNIRFVNLKPKKRNNLKKTQISTVHATAEKQDPFASIVSCIDSRIPPETIFDQGIGDLFVSRVAGNFVNNDILGGLEFGSKQYDSKLIVIMGHNSCGAVGGACAGVVQGFLTDTLSNITPAVREVLNKKPATEKNCSIFKDKIAEKNVKLNIKKLLDRDTILRNLVKNKKIKLVGAMYNVADGKVIFFD